MNVFMVFIVMLFFHVLDDFHFQGILASMKQRDWWDENYPSPLYKFDYMCALGMHAFSWTFMIMLPLLFCLRFHPTEAWWLAFVCNFIIHASVDDLKANAKVINLWTDQLIHIAQIMFTIFAVGLSM